MSSLLHKMIVVPASTLSLAFSFFEPAPTVAAYVYFASLRIFGGGNDRIHQPSSSALSGFSPVLSCIHLRIVEKNIH